MGLSLKQRLNAFNDEATQLNKALGAHLADKNIPLSERWELFITAEVASVMKLNVDSYCQNYDILEERNYDWYSDFYIERYTYADNANIVRQLEELITYDEDNMCFTARLTRDELDGLKEEMLQSGARFWTMDW